MSPTARFARTRRFARRDDVRIVAGLAPLLLSVTALFGTAVGLAVLRSLGVGPFTASDDPTLAAYRRLLADPEFLSSVGLTTHVAATSTVLAAVLGTASALVLHRAVRARRSVTALFGLNLPIPHIIGAVAILALLGQSGLISRVATRAGLLEGPAAFPALVFDRWAVGIIVQYVWKELVFIGIVALAMLRSAGDDLDEAARTLGASGWQRLRHVTLPLILPGVLAAAVIAFAFSFGTFEVPLLLGGSYPAVLPVLAHRRFTDVDLAARPEAMAIGVVITVLVVLIVAVGAALARRAVRPDAT